MVGHPCERCAVGDHSRHISKITTGSPGCFQAPHCACREGRERRTEETDDEAQARIENEADSPIWDFVDAAIESNGKRTTPAGAVFMARELMRWKATIEAFQAFAADDGNGQAHEAEVIDLGLQAAHRTP